MWGTRASWRAAAALSGPRRSSPEEASQEKGKREVGARVGRGDQPSWSLLGALYTASAGLGAKGWSASSRLSTTPPHPSSRWGVCILSPGQGWPPSRHLVPIGEGAGSEEIWKPTCVRS